MPDIVLCVRAERFSEDSDDAKIDTEMEEAFRARFGDDLLFLYANPHTPEDLDLMTRHPGHFYRSLPADEPHNVVAVSLHERPLPTIVVDKGEVPCVVPTPGGLMRLKEVKAVLEPL